MLCVADVAHSRGGDLLGVGGQHIARVTSEDNIDHLAHKAPVEFDEVVGHLFEKEHLFAVVAEEDIAYHLLAVVVLRGDDVCGAGVPQDATMFGSGSEP